ncbi:MAG: 2-C-methyl-D-erythritol 2,4-cyclodiphosphate synthase [Clostridia bacterium]|nr:2-C-methyl-D-erythritol 2,4-cyclodiphosphate synthase [Clostridia bacterium]
MKRYALLMAAGSGTRTGLPGNKVLHPLDGRTILERSAEPFLALTDGLVIVVRRADMEAVRALGIPATLVAGGDTRQRSVLNGLRALPEDAEIVLVHDAARPFVAPELIARCIESAETHGSGVAAIPASDTHKYTLDGRILETLDRSRLFAAQTPQAFKVSRLRDAIEALEREGLTATDDSAALEAAGDHPFIVPGAPENQKITDAIDIRRAEWLLSEKNGRPVRVGSGYDAHRLVRDRKLVLCGVEIPHTKGLLGHSDADVACHALIDALLGAAARGDIGTHFPDTDGAYFGVSSILLLRKTVELLHTHDLSVGNVDITIVAQKPKLRPHVPPMIQSLAKALAIPEQYVSVKATTTEGLGFEGEEKGMSAQAVATVIGP